MNFITENKLNFSSGDKVFFTSDTHFYHKNILEYSYRPFKSVEEMNRVLIDNWNRVVPKDGIVFHLGDFGFLNSAQFDEIFNQLNGKIYLCVGNHDLKLLSENHRLRFEDVRMQYYIKVEDQCIYLNHFPYLCYNGTYRSTPIWQLFGHVHSKEKERDHKGLDIKRLYMLFESQYDVGVDNNNYTPLSFNQVKEIINNKLVNKMESKELREKLNSICLNKIGCKDGWLPLLIPIYDFLVNYNNTHKTQIKLTQVKEKFGILTIYYNTNDIKDYDLDEVNEGIDLLQELILTASKESNKICEFCGSKINVEKTTEGWIKTLCPTCREKWYNRHK